MRNERFNAKDWGSALDHAAAATAISSAASSADRCKQDKTFFFGSYSGLRQTTSTFLNNAIVPTALERIGDFSASADQARRSGDRTIFACNGVVGVICPNRLDPVALKIINKLHPGGQRPGQHLAGLRAQPVQLRRGPGEGRPPDAPTRTGSPAATSITGGTNTVAAGTGNLPWASQQFNWRQHNVNVSDTWVLDSSKINQAWFTFTRNFGGRLNLPQTSLGDLGSAFNIQGAPSLPQITVSGYFTLSNAIGGPMAGGNFYSGRDVFSWTTGRHALKLGGELSLQQDIQDTLLNNYGVFTFNNSVTKNALADFVIGIPSAVTQDAPVTAYWNSWYGASFLQDDFRVNARLTLNLGLRWDVQTPGTDPLNRFTTYVPGAEIARSTPRRPSGSCSTAIPASSAASITTAWNHVSPRVGIVWDPTGDGKTSIRAAAGMFYGSISGNEWNTMTNFQPWSTRLTFTNTNPKTSATGVPLGASLSNPYNAYRRRRPVPLQRVVRQRRRHLRRGAGLRVGARLPDQRRASSARSVDRSASARRTSAPSTATSRLRAT